MKSTLPSQGGLSSGPSVRPSGLQPAGSATIVAVMLLLGRLGGLVRDLIVAPLFGAGPEVDALVAARTVPELLLTLVTAGAITSGFMPALAFLSRGRSHLPEDGVKAISVVTNWLLLATLLFTLFGLLFPELLIAGVTPGLDAGREEQAASLLRVIMPVTVLVTAAAVLGVWLNFRGYFALPSARALVTNMTIIVLTLMLARSLGIVSVAVGWVVGAFLQVLLLVPVARRSGARYRWGLDLRAPNVGEVGRIILPIVLAQLLLYGRTLAERQFGSWLPPGDLAYLSYAYRIGTAPMMIVANAVIIAYLPVFASRAAEKDGAGLLTAVGQSIRLMLLGTLPFVVIFATLPRETIRLLMEHGAFSPADTATTSHLLTWYSLALVGGSLTMLLSQVFYGRREGERALYAAAAGVAGQVATTAWLLPRYGVSGVAIGTALGLVLSAVILSVMLVRSLPPVRGERWLLHGGKILSPAAAMLAVTLLGAPVVDALGLPLSAGGCYALTVGLGLLVYAGLAWWLGAPELKDLGKWCRRKVGGERGM